MIALYWAIYVDIYIMFVFQEGCRDSYFQFIFFDLCHKINVFWENNGGNY